MRKLIYVLIGCWGFALQATGQAKLFRGNWYVGTESGIVSSNTRMSTGELALYSTGWSGIMPMAGIKVGYDFAPYFSVETGLSSLPLNLVYLYKTDKVIGTNPLRFVDVPLRLKGRVFVFNDQLEAYATAGLHYIYTNADNQTFSGNLVTRQHTYNDTLAYEGRVDVLRRHSLAAELGVGISWAFSKRWKLNVAGRQLMGLLNVAEVDVSIKESGADPNQASFLSRGSGFSLSVGVQYQFRLKR